MSELRREQGQAHLPDKRWVPGLPLDSLEDTVASRRGFLTILLGGSVGLFLATLPFARRFVRRREERFPKVIVAAAGEVSPGEARPFAYPSHDKPALLLHLLNGEWRAYSGMCTHLGCVVYWDRASNRLICPCHNAAFAADTGAVLMGPPLHPLPAIDLRVEDGTVFAVGMKKT